MLDEPESLLPIVREERAKYSTPIPNEQLGVLLNAIALRGGEGWGLAAKSTGAHTAQPVTGTLVSPDLLIHAPSNIWFDVLIDYENAATPSWQNHGQATMEWVAPVPTDAPDLTGKLWPFFADGRAPIVVMTPTGNAEESTPGAPPGELDPDEVWDGFLEQYSEVVITPGWDGTHTPIQNTWRSQIRELAKLNRDNGKVSAFWCVDQHDSEAEAMAMLELLASKIGDIPNVIVGPTFDVFENWTVLEVDEWLAWARTKVPATWVLCARARPGITYEGDVAAFEDHINDIDAADAVAASMIWRSGGRPAWNSERFRDHSNFDPEKDWAEKDMPTGINVFRDRRVGAIFGIKGSLGSVNQYGSRAPKKALLPEFQKALVGEEPLDPPAFMYVTALGIVDYGKLFQIRWAAVGADHVELRSDTHGPIDYGLPTEGVLDQRVKATTRYLIEAVRDDEVTGESFDVECRPRRKTWWEILLGWLGRR